MTVVFDRPYEFIPPIRSTVWPWVIQRLRLYDYYLRRKEGVVGYELRGIEHCKKAIDDGHSILLAPNHCRYADPLVLGWPGRQLGFHVHAMASWHLFNEGALDSFAIRRMGGFSVFREGNDRKALEAAIEILTEGRRPLIVFPEGTTNRTNDELKPLLDGVAFMARTAAKRRRKRKDDPETAATAGSGDVYMQPVAIKYVCVEKIDHWAHEQLDRFEMQIGWNHMPTRDIRARTLQLAEAMLALKETQYYGRSCGGPLPERRDTLIEHILTITEQQMSIDNTSDVVRERVRNIRAAASSRFFSEGQRPEVKQELRRHVDSADLAQDLSSYPDSYLTEDQVTDTRIVETIQRMQETVNGKADHSIPLKAIIQFTDPIKVDTGRPPKGQRDPLMQSLEDSLSAMLRELSSEARKL
ncbi:lysophospholipid acyltransferase family protein [Rhodopirellula sp. MGV]|uniref:lysophospholipid acyltransferase family protein n=1 Tax=Rhodopirellula sp. MGV TaxID=2023130 RepID=UPI000B979B1A|nr:1-acyl-sn-glycerol-3-phosphate acyltransferase [Rhodopirellula sp. MGV]OYP29844.1 1-acyl-sn-glycerol-3-phosphate acyltransferase [Rhodopirellula sp. MGV]PNY33726.1 1-acyl-sn-glycerol-3-phosphate acyltransferase [Rhodopirellula baltica]